VRRFKRILRSLGLRRPKRRFYNPLVRTRKITRGWSARRINFLLPLSGLGKRYLEVGVFTARNFEAVKAEWKVGVDPNPMFHSALLPKKVAFFRQTSDDFFQTYSGANFDLIFLDGLHEASTTYRDFIEASNRLNVGGTILIDDVLPSDQESSLPNRNESEAAKLNAGIGHMRWYGDVWRVAWLIIQRYPDFDIWFIGDGIQEHCQAVVRRKFFSSLPMKVQKEDIDFMAKFDYMDVVETGPGSLRGLAVSESVALDSIATFVRP